jgi:uncharacterized protein (TIGR00303 family)
MISLENRLSVVHSAVGVAEQFLTAQFAVDKTAFLLCLGSTETSDIEGISAAGATPEARRLTPAIDAEALVSGRTFSSGSIPVSPIGIVSPVVITRACLTKLNIAPRIFDCGSFVSPQNIECRIVGQTPAAAVSTGSALTLLAVENLFSEGKKVGEQLAQEFDLVVISECVPGGTTTALGVLKLLGHEADRLLSSSLPISGHDARLELVNTGIARAIANGLLLDPLAAIAAVGDPMQPFAAGLAIGAAKKSVLLAGGSQMLAVYAIVDRLLKRSYAAAASADTDASRICVATTKWVAFDPSANCTRLAELIGAPLVAACPDFKLSKHRGLQAYEEGNVKEGVGAGGALTLAFQAGFTESEIVEAIDATYSEMVAI